MGGHFFPQGPCWKLSSSHRNFEVFKAGEFIAAITQHIPDKGFQMVRYYGWYSNKSRGVRRKKASASNPATGTEMIVVSEHGKRKIPSKKWRELIKKVWECDPLTCPQCGGEMKIIGLIDDACVIKNVLRELKLEPFVADPPARPPPPKESIRSCTGFADPVYEDGSFIDCVDSDYQDEIQS